MWFEVVVLERIRGVDAAAVETSADQVHRLVVVARKVSAVLSDPATRQIEWRDHPVDLLLFLAPPSLLKFLGSDACSAEVLLELIARLLGAQMPVLGWWATAAILTRASTTLTLLSIFIVGIGLYVRDLATIGDIVIFSNFTGLVIARLEQMVGFVNRLLLDGPRLKDFFDVLDTTPAVRDRPNAIDPAAPKRE